MALDARPRLTDLSHGAGCACKIGPGQLRDVLAQLPQQIDAALLVGSETCDDAGVYRISDDLALVQTVDFFTPIVDDPRDFGRIAAANALSDIYAMGAQPLTALNLVGFSIEQHGADTLAAILAGGAEIAAQAGVPIVGGHSIDDPEPKYGMAITGVVNPAQGGPQLERPRARRAVPDEADRRRRRHDRGEARHGGRRGGAPLHRSDDDAER